MLVSNSEVCFGRYSYFREVISCLLSSLIKVFLHNYDLGSSVQWFRHLQFVFSVIKMCHLIVIGL